MLEKCSLSRMTKPLPWGSHVIIFDNESNDKTCNSISGNFMLLMIGLIGFGSGSLGKDAGDGRGDLLQSWKAQ